MLFRRVDSRVVSWAVAAILVPVAGGVWALEEPAPGAPPEGGHAVRAALLTREHFGIKKSGKEKILCAVVDLNGGAGVATLAAHMPGEVSLYLADGNSMERLDRIRGVKVAGSQFYKRVKSARDLLQPATEFPQPGAGQIAFYLVTSKATLSSGVLDQAAVGAEDHPLHELARKADSVLTQIRLSQKR